MRCINVGTQTDAAFIPFSHAVSLNFDLYSSVSQKNEEVFFLFLPFFLLFFPPPFFLGGGRGGLLVAILETRRMNLSLGGNDHQRSVEV